MIILIQMDLSSLTKSGTVEITPNGYHIQVKEHDKEQKYGDFLLYSTSGFLVSLYELYL